MHYRMERHLFDYRGEIFTAVLAHFAIPADEQFIVQLLWIYESSFDGVS